ncbi:MAG: 16S rRNA (uracil(1498)-N(3))-methyltransferase [Acidobacteria bacterium]|nr:16S rRNA (uracil(1498)-N(3))-methyltransferase [Acidobacteriota bacterium]
MISLLVSPLELHGEEIEVTGDAYRHLFRARRLASGAELRVTDGAGRARWGRVGRIGPRTAEVRLAAEAPVQDPDLSVRLLVSVPRFQRASWLVEKATELGAAEIRFLQSERTVHPLTPGNLERLQRVAAAALEQCHGSTLPRISGLHEFSEVPALIDGCGRRRFLDLAESGDEARNVATEPGLFPRDPVALLVGPEGGWSAAERLQLAAWGCQADSLGRRVLRVETAAVVGLGSLLAAASWR